MQHLVGGIQHPNPGHVHVEVAHHGIRAPVEDGAEGIAAGEREPDFRAQGGQAGLLEGGLGGGAFAFEGVTDRPLQNVGPETGLDEVIRRAGFHRLHVDFMLAQAGQQNDRRLAAARHGFLQQINAAFRAPRR